VLLFHLGVATYGPYGVMGFFVLSGFLITWLLLAEREATGAISLRKFYFRRALRIFPGFYAFWIVYLLLDLFYLHRVDAKQYVSLLFYAGNYYKAIVKPNHTVMLHNWSLAVEEQFYLLWPLVFRRYQDQLPKLTRLLTGVIVFVWIYRFVLHFAFGVGEDWIYYAFDARADHLAIGCLLAVLLYQGKFRGAFDALCAGRILPAVTILLLTLTVRWIGYYNTPRALTFGYAILPVLIAVLLVQLIALSGNWPWKLFETGIGRYLGRISYSMYLYHWLVCWVVLFRMPPMNAFARIAIAVPGSIAVASVSYFCVEQPFLRLKERFRVKTSTPDCTVAGS
jgi:peptidoglycan/LPS O-acetylase OafA/YrhL